MPSHRKREPVPSAEIATGVAAELQAWRIRALNALLITICIVATPRMVKSVIEAVTEPQWWPQTIPFVVLYLLLVAVAALRRLDYRLRAWILTVVGYGFGVVSLAWFGLVGNGPLTLLALPVLSLILLGVRSGLLMTAFSLLTYAAFTLFAYLGWLPGWLIVTENPVTAGEWLGTGGMFAALLLMLVVMEWFFSRAQGQALVQARQMAAELATAHSQLQARTDELDRYARLMEMTARIARDTTSLLDRSVLLQHTVNLIARRLGCDRVAVYLSGGETGESVLAAASGQPIAAESAVEPPPAVVRLFREWTSQTLTLSDQEPMRHELALPLHVGGQVIGALDIHVSRSTPFSSQEVTALQGLADQLAVALENARLFGEAQESLRELEALYRHYTAEAWQRFMAERPRSVQIWQGEDRIPPQAWQALAEQARSSGTAATAFDPEVGRHLLAVPVKLRDLPIGVLGFHRPAEAGPWGGDQIAAIEAVADRLALATDNLRLLDETQRRAARERQTRQIADKMRRAADLEALMKITLQEAATALGASRAFVQLSALTEPQVEDHGQRIPAGQADGNGEKG